LKDLVIGYVPVDSRPVNYNYPILLSEIAGFKILTPPKEFLGDLNLCGNAQKICNFLEEKSDKLKILIVSLDMLGYGGLIFSRKLNTTFQGAYQRIQVLRKIKERNPKLLIYGFNVILRISTSVTDEESYHFWKMIFKYSILKDKIERNKNNKKEELEFKRLKKEIPEHLLEEYFTVRRRNHNINIKVLEMVKERIIDFLIFSQEDAAEFGPHRREQEILLKMREENNLEEKISFQTGCDEIGMQLLCKYFNNIRNFSPNIFLFPPVSKLKFISLYEDIPVFENLRRKADSLNIKIKENLEDSDFIFLINTFKNKQKDIFLEEDINNRDCRNFWKDFKKYFEKEYKISIADIFYCNGSDEKFLNFLIKEGKIPQLLSYAGWNTTGNTLGSALSHSCIAFKIDSKIKLKKHLEFLLIRFLEDFIYSLRVRKFLNEHLKKKGISPYNIKRDFKEIEKIMQRQMQVFSEKFFEENFKSRVVEISGEKFKIKKLKNINFSFPFRRIFEIKTEVSLEIE
jgi:hypothetical protein